MNRVERMLQELPDDGLPQTGFEIDPNRTAIVITDPQNDFLHPDGVAYGVCGESVEENGTVDNLLKLMQLSKESGLRLFISPHYYYPTDPRLEVRRDARTGDAQHSHVRSQGRAQPRRLRKLRS